VGAQADPIDELHDDPRDALVLEDLEDRHDVRVRDLRGGPSLAHEPSALKRLGHVLRPGPLEGDQALELLVARPIDDPHAAPAQLGDQLVMEDGRVGYEETQPRLGNIARGRRRVLHVRKYDRERLTVREDALKSGES
jgi:hypothetical protein